MRQRIDCNFGWEFTPNWTKAFARFEDVPDAQRVDLPHTCAETPYDYFDESAYQMVCGYRRTLKIPEEWAGKYVAVTFGAAAHRRLAELADACGMTGSTDAVSTTGLAEGGDENYPEGTVWIGVAGPAGTRTLLYQCDLGRKGNIRRFSTAALQFLASFIKEDLNK